MHGRAWPCRLLWACSLVFALALVAPFFLHCTSLTAHARKRAHYYSHARIRPGTSMESGASRVVALAIGHLTRLAALRDKQQETPPLIALARVVAQHSN